MAKRGKTTGAKAKFGGRHSSVIDIAESLLNTISKSPLVSKISPGHIESSRKKSSAGQPRLKCTLFPAKVEVTIRSSSTRQIIHVYGDSIEAIRDLIHASWRYDITHSKNEETQDESASSHQATR